MPSRDDPAYRELPLPPALAAVWSRGGRCAKPRAALYRCLVGAVRAAGIHGVVRPGDSRGGERLAVGVGDARIRWVTDRPPPRGGAIGGTH